MQIEVRIDDWTRYPKFLAQKNVSERIKLSPFLL